MKSERIPKSNLHTHTCFCDGKHTPEEMVLAAIEAGMDTLGFSGHSYTSFDTRYCMSLEDTQKYQSEILRLKRQYENRLHILLGIEQDIYADFFPQGYDYVIGSVHYIRVGDSYFSVDESRESLVSSVKKYYRGDFYAFAKDYFQTVAQLPVKTPCNIIGHFDLISKFNDDGSLFEPTDPRYLRAALDALDTLLQYDVIFEINTGAMSRGYRRTPYPAPIFLRRIAERGGRVTLCADAHSRDHLLYGFPLALHIAEVSGLGGIQVMTRNGWENFHF